MDVWKITVEREITKGYIWQDKGSQMITLLCLFHIAIASTLQIARNNMECNAERGLKRDTQKERYKEACMRCLYLVPADVPPPKPSHATYLPVPGFQGVHGCKGWERVKILLLKAFL